VIGTDAARRIGYLYMAAAVSAASLGALIITAAGLGLVAPQSAAFGCVAGYTFFSVGAINYFASPRTRWTRLFLHSANFSGAIVSAIAAAALRTAVAYVAAVLVTTVAICALSAPVVDWEQTITHQRRRS
jgi:hypothetical protein